MILRQGFRQGLLPQRGALLELGQANWYGDMPIEVVIADMQAMIEDQPRREAIIAAIRAAAQSRQPDAAFDFAKAIYRALFDPVRIDAIDFHGTAAALKLDLNEPSALERQYDVIINTGTAEHIFNIGQVFKTMHGCTKPGGPMFHESPFTGWIDHGFYSLQPTLFFDLAAVNRYDLLGIFYFDWKARTLERVGNRDAIKDLMAKHGAEKNTNLFTVLRKGAQDSNFAYPIQGYYDGKLTPTQAKAWLEDR
jgi:hypothetical protein